MASGGRTALLLFLIQLGVIGFFARHATMLTFDNSIDRFAVKGHEAGKRYAEFIAAFEAAEYVIVSIERRSEVITLQQLRETGEGVFKRFGGQAGIEAYYSFHNTVPQSYRERFLPGSAEVQTAMLPYFDGEGRFYSAVFRMTTKDVAAKAHLLETLLDLTREEEKAQPELKIHLTGEPILNHYLNQSAQEVKERLFPVLIGFSLLLVGFLFRSLKTLVVAGVAVGGALAVSMGVLHLAGERMDLITTLIPSLVFVLGMAMLMHVLLSIAHAGDIVKGIRGKLRANALVALTTSIGFGSLISSSVTPIATMGAHMALGIWVIFAMIHLTLLGLGLLLNLRVSPPKRFAVHRWFHGPAYARFISLKALILLPIVVVVLGTWALLVNPSQSNGLNYFASDHPIRMETHVVERYITGTSNIEILLKARYTEDEDELDPEFLESADRFERALAKMEHVRHLISLNRILALPFVGETEAEEGDSEWRHGVGDIALDYLKDHAYRICVLVDTIDKPAYDELLDNIETAWREAGLDQVPLITGGLDRVMEVQSYLLESLAASLLLTLVCVVGLMFLWIRGGLGLVLVLLPNLFPLAAMALLMWALGIETTISSVMVFSIAFGIAVDDTIHLLDSFLSKPGDTFYERWQATLRRDAAAIFLTTLILTMGFLILTISSFLPTVHFGILLAFGMCTAFLGDVLFLPILLGRLHRGADPTPSGGRATFAD